MELENIKVVGTFLNGRPKNLSNLRAMEGILKEKFLWTTSPIIHLRKSLGNNYRDGKAVLKLM